MLSSNLSVKYALLHRIEAANWVPTNHTSTIPTGLGKFIFIVGTKLIMILVLISMTKQ